MLREGRKVGVSASQVPWEASGKPNQCINHFPYRKNPKMSTIMITFKANVPIMEVQYFVKEDRIKRVFWHWNLAKIHVKDSKNRCSENLRKSNPVLCKKNLQSFILKITKVFEILGFEYFGYFWIIFPYSKHLLQTYKLYIQNICSQEQGW